jgi:hypothetical protein
MIPCYGVAMPSGRIPESGEARDKVFSVRLSQSEVKKMDKVRGEKERSVFMRDAILNASREK